MKLFLLRRGFVETASAAIWPSQTPELMNFIHFHPSLNVRIMILKSTRKHFTGKFGAEEKNTISDDDISQGVAMVKICGVMSMKNGPHSSACHTLIILGKSYNINCSVLGSCFF